MAKERRIKINSLYGGFASRREVLKKKLGTWKRKRISHWEEQKKNKQSRHCGHEQLA